VRVIGYARVSTEEQGLSGAGLEARRQAIIGECERRGWTLIKIAEDAGSDKNMKRPDIRAALDVLAARDRRRWWSRSWTV
jgi:DNA invertase Pin-like site-specific DNA recombinase